MTGLKMEEFCSKCGQALPADRIRPMSEWKPGWTRVRPPDEAHWRFGRGWGIGKIDGAKGYTNGHFMLVGQPPTGDAILEGKQPNFALALEKVRKAGEPVPVHAVAFGPVDSGIEVVWFDSGSAVNRAYYDHILERYPGAEFRAAGIMAGHFIFDAGRLVGCLMPLNPYSLSVPAKEALAIGGVRSPISLEEYCAYGGPPHQARCAVNISDES